MRPAPTKPARGHLGRGALLSLLLHAQVLVPMAVAAFIYGAREDARRAEEVDVAFEDVAPEDLPTDLPALDALKNAADSLDRLEPQARKALKLKAKKRHQKVAAQDLAKSEPEIIVPPLPPMPEPPPPERHENHKMVDLDNDHDVDAPPDAKFLAQKNNWADEETRATETNLEHAQQGEAAASSRSSRANEAPGSDREKIAQLADQKSALGKKAPSVTPHANPQLSSEDEKELRQSLLALRDPAPRAHEITPETADPSLPRADDGEIRQRRPTARGQDSRADRARGKRMKLAITGSDYEYMFGADAEADRRLSKTLKSSRQGSFEKRQARVRSALENFIPEVKPGNQTALNTRAAPFAAFIARMHRSIHQLWGFGMLEAWDELPSTNPLNNPNLLTTLEMVLNADGTVHKVTMVHASGFMEYDVAAIDAAYSAGPYPDPPREIRSANGKIYLHWRFYRDGRACATSGVDYFILDNPPPDSDKASLAELESARVPRAPSPSRTAEGPRRLRRDLSDSAHQAKMQALDEEVARAERNEAVEAPAPRPSATRSPVAEAQAPAARTVAQRWFAALVAGDIATVSSLAEIPFRTTGGAPIRARADLVAMLKDLSGELSRKRPESVQVFTSAGIRGVLGRIPPGIDDGSGLLFALAPLPDGDSLLLALAKRGDSYKVVGLVRR
jgi:TonB C terminal